MRSFIVIIGTVVFMWGSCFQTLAQNSHLVEKTVEDLDKINKEALRHVPDIPRDGTIKIKGKGIQKGDDIEIDVERYEVTFVKEGSIELDGRKGGSKSVDKENPDER